MSYQLPSLRLVSAGLALAYVFNLTTVTAEPSAPSAVILASPESLRLPDGREATVSPLGIARIVSKDGRSVMLRRFPVVNKTSGASFVGGFSDKAQLAYELGKPPRTTPYANGRVIVVYRNGIGSAHDNIVVPKKTLLAIRGEKTALKRASLAPAYTSDVATNKVLATLGVDRSDRLFSHVSVRPAFNTSALNISNAYLLHVTASGVHNAVAILSKSPAVVYASPDWYVGPARTPAFPIPQRMVSAASRAGVAAATRFGRRAFSVAGGSVPANFMLNFSGQSLLNAPSTNAAAALDEIQNVFHQLPGHGQIITNVSIGDVAYSGNCRGETTTHFINGQMYIDWPSMPLIAAYSSDGGGKLSGSKEVCGADPSLGEVGLDFSMMAPLPHDQQRPGAVGSGLTDLLGIAPGATYRLVVPQDTSGTISGLAAAFQGAATQDPRPNVITASLGFGFDTLGFPGRYLEDDPLMEAVIASIIDNYNIVVCISANDGTRTYTNVAIGPSGGSAPTVAIRPGETPTDLNDIALSTGPSRDFDSGAIDVGGSTLDDIFAAPPQDPQFSNLRAQHAFPETRWDGMKLFSSGFGSRVNVSAPSDNVVALFCGGCYGGQYNAVFPALEGGTSASAPEAAAAAAVALQVARLTGHPFQKPLQVREFLEKTGTPVPPVSQSDVNIHIGPQINVANIVETLLSNAQKPVKAGLNRVAVEQRRNFGLLDSIFLTATDPTNIDLVGPCCDNQGATTDQNQRAWITIAPDWEGLPRNAQFRLNVVGHYTSPLAATRWARLLPEQILRAAGLPLASTSSRTVNLRYRAFTGIHLLAERIFSLTFGPASSTTEAVLAPVVPSVVRGPSISVNYDLRGSRGFPNPKLIVSRADRFDPSVWSAGAYFNVAYTVALSAQSGTVQVPVSALQGGGIYGVGIVNDTAQPDPFAKFPTYSDFAFVRLAPTLPNRPAAPLLSIEGGQPGHFLEIPDNSAFHVSWNVSNVPGANGALLEFSAPGVLLNPFNNPNGTRRDYNGYDSPSVYAVPVAASGTMSLTSKNAHLVPTFNQVVRVIPMTNGAAAGEAGDVSTVQTDGVLPSDGGTVNFGYATDPRGDDAFLTSNLYASATGNVGSLQTFSQKTNSITNTIADPVMGGQSSTPALGGATIYSNDVGLYMPAASIGAPSVPIEIISPLSGTIVSAWTPPAVVQQQSVPLLQAVNDQRHDGVFLAGSNGDASADGINHYSLVFTSNVAANTFGPLYDVASTLPTCQQKGCVPYKYFALAENIQTNTAVLGAGIVGLYFPKRLGPPNQTEVVTVDLAKGKLDSFYLPTGFDTSAPQPHGLVVDSTTNKAFMPLDDGRAAFINLKQKTAKIVNLPGAAGKPPAVVGFQRLTRNDFAGEFPAVDSQRHLFLLAQAFSSDVLSNYNSLTSLLIYTESGDLLSRRENLDIFNATYFSSANNLQINQRNRSGYIFSRNGSQLEPIKY